MNIELTVEQQLLRQSVRDLLGAVMPVESVQRQADDPLTQDDGVLWSKLAELGLPGILVPEELGGVGLGFAEAALVLEELGSGLGPGGFMASGIVSAAALLACPQERAEGILGALAAGERRVALAAGPGLVAQSTSNGYVLDGRIPLVAEARHADTILVEAQLAGESAVFAVAASASGCAVEPVLTMDPTRRFDRVTLSRSAIDPTSLLVANQAASAALRAAAEAEMLGIACDSLGGSHAALTLAANYAKEREQFGVMIGSFQAIKHMLADTLVALWNARAAVAHAIDLWDSRADDRLLSIRAAKVLACQNYVQSAANCIQVHAGIGFTKELPAHLYFRRAKMNDVIAGSSLDHLHAIGDSLEQLAGAPVAVA